MKFILFFIYFNAASCNLFYYADKVLEILFLSNCIKNFDQNHIYLKEESLSIRNENFVIADENRALFQTHFLNINGQGCYLDYQDLFNLTWIDSLDIEKIQTCSKTSDNVKIGFKEENGLSNRSNKEVLEKSNQQYKEAMIHYREAREHLIDAIIHAGGAAASLEFCLPLSGLEIYKSAESIKKMCDEYLKGYELEHGGSKSNHDSRSDWTGDPSNFQPEYETDTLKLHD